MVRCPDTRLSLTALGSIYGRVTTQLTGKWSLCSDQTRSVVCGLATVQLYDKTQPAVGVDEVRVQQLQACKLCIDIRLRC